MDNLNKRKELAAKVFGVGKNKILFNTLRLSEIKEAITKQDIRDLYNDGAIMVREVNGRRKKAKRTTRKGPGKIKWVIGNKKRKYITITRKLRAYVSELRIQGKITMPQYNELRKKIKARTFKDKAHLKEQMGFK
jgi:large subunit ribosomal protein L19e